MSSSFLPCFRVRPVCVWLGTAFLSITSAALCAADSSSPAGDETYRLDQVLVEGSQTATPALGSTTISLAGRSDVSATAATNAYDLIDTLPSVYRESSDAFGLSEKNQHPAIKIRGKASSGPVAIRNVEGVPLQGTPGGGDHFIDLENIATVTLHKGAFAPQDGLGFSNLIGKIDLAFDKPHAEAGLTTTQTVGTEDFYRGFVRVDGGERGGVRTFLSGSFAQADKFKGFGDYSRDNYTFGLATGGANGLSAEAYAIYNDFTQYDYRYLTYAQATNLSAYKGYDFTDVATDTACYRYNMQSFEDVAALALLRYRWSASDVVMLKPYYWQDEGYYLSAAQTGMIRKWVIDHDLYGAVAEWAHTGEMWSFVTGAFWHRQQRPGSPTAWKMYAVASGTPVFKKWGLLSNDSYHELASPYATLGWKSGALRLSAGARYVDLKIASQLSYTTTAGDVSYAEALRLATPDTGASVGSLGFHELLPYAAAEYELNKQLTVYAGYNRTYGFDVNLYPSYISGRTSFKVPLAQIYEHEKLELSDNFDLGLRWAGEKWSFKPSVYYTSVSNKQISVYDPAIVVAGATYPTNAADAHSAGAELETTVQLLPALELRVAGSSTIFEYDEDLTVLDTSGATTSAKGHQVVDAPEYLANVGLTYRWHALSIAPALRYVGRRYADSANSQSLGGRTLYDLRLTYAFSIPAWKIRGAEISVGVVNVFDKEYIGVISASDYINSGASGSATFLAGSPRAFTATLALKF